ncbi:MAG: histidine phosphatase family protein [Actinomycetota bacterium]
MDRLILVRHAESAYGAKNLVNGDPYRYVPLSRRGRRQARELGRALSDEPIQLAVTTRFPRTRETADLALGDRPIPRLVLAEFDDVKLGDFEGRPVEELRAWQRVHGPADPLPGGGESRVDSVRRHLEGYRILLRRDESVVLAVLHGLPVTIVRLALRGESVPVTLEEVQAEPATPYVYSAQELTAAVRALRAWVAQAVSA